MTLSKLFIESLSLDYYMSSSQDDIEARQIALQTAQIFLQNDSAGLQMQDIVGFDIHGRDHIYKAQNDLLWRALELTERSCNRQIAELRSEIAKTKSLLKKGKTSA